MFRKPFFYKMNEFSEKFKTPERRASLLSKIFVPCSFKSQHPNINLEQWGKSEWGWPNMEVPTTGYGKVWGCIFGRQSSRPTGVSFTRINENPTGERAWYLLEVHTFQSWVALLQTVLSDRRSLQQCIHTACYIHWLTSLTSFDHHNNKNWPFNIEVRRLFLVATWPFHHAKFEFDENVAV